MQETHKISSLEQVRLLTDPLKLKLIQSFAESAKTTKQVASELGESITKLYRHVDALYAAGLLDIVEERQKRGTIERTFRAVAQRFEADHKLFASDDGAAGLDSIKDLLRASEAEILDALASSSDNEDEQPIVMRIRGKASPEKIAELRETLKTWLDSIPSSDEKPAQDAADIGGLIAFYQLEK